MRPRGYRSFAPHFLFPWKNKNSGIWYKMNSNGLKYDIVSAQEYPDDKAFKFRIRLLEGQTILENDYVTPPLDFVKIWLS